MSAVWNNFFSVESFIPHGHCYLWKPSLVGLHLISDSLIALAYYSIPITLLYFVKKREDLPFNWIFLLFCAFIMACGTTHLMEVWTLWHPNYWLAGLLKASTAVISLVTAIELIPITPQALALPSPAQLEQANLELQAQIAEKVKIEGQLKDYQIQLEQRVAERTSELAKSYQRMEELLEREQEARTQTEKAKVEIQRYAEELTKALEIARQNEETAKRQLAEIEAIYATAPIGLCVLDTEFRFIRINELLAEINGLPVSEHIGHTVSDILPDLGKLQEPIFRRVLQSGEPVLNIEVHGTTQVQTEVERDWLVNYYPLRGTDDYVLGVNITVLEITDRKLAEKEIERRAEELTVANTTLARTSTLLKERNQELNQFAYVVSHDLKSPLRAIASLSEWIEEDLADLLPQENRYHLHLLRKRVYRMEALINGLLNYSRIGRTEVAVERVVIKTFISEIIDSLAPPDTFTIEITSNVLIIATKRLLLGQVFANLLDNALKHHDCLHGKIKITVQEQPDFYEFSVSDDGPGIEPKYHQKIFTIFQTLHPRDVKENTGIGLSIVKKIIETEGGSIRVESQLGQGTTFRFTWPKIGVSKRVKG